MGVFTSYLTGIIVGTQIYPSSSARQAEIPLWLTLRCFPFSKNSVIRSTVAAVGLPTIRTIMVPAPKNFQTKCAIRYDDKNEPQNLTQADPSGEVEGLMKFVPGLSTVVGWVKTSTKINDYVSEQLGFGASENLDMYDSTFQGVSKRVFGFKIIMPAWTVEDSEAASDIINTLEAFALPQAKFLTLLNKSVEHPPMWQVGIGRGTSTDISWTGQPQLCVLTSVVSSKMGFEDAYGISDSSEDLKPLCQVIEISFIEIEPALRSAAGTNTIINRSTAFVTGGVSVT